MNERNKSEDPPVFDSVITSNVPNGEIKMDLVLRTQPEEEKIEKSVSISVPETFKNEDEEGKGRYLNYTLKIFGILGFLYFFICSLGFLSDSFRLIAGKAAGEVLQTELLNNPIVGMMIGILVTVAVQSSSTSTSIVVSMVSSGLFSLKTAIPIVMGANLGTSVTNTIVALTHMTNRADFERAFGGAVLHDMFNLLTVTSLLTLEVCTGYLEVTTTAIMDCFELKAQKGGEIQILSRITKPFTQLIIQINKKVIIGWSLKDPAYDDARLLNVWCNRTIVDGNTTEIIPQKCQFLFNYFDLDDFTLGLILLIFSLVILCGSLILLVKVLSSLLKGKLALAVQRGVNANIPYFPCLTGYFAMGIGALMTILVQSSSVFTSALTPLIALGMITLDRAYPLTLGSNLGTTTTAMLAALSADGPNLRLSIQIALCHFLFNMTGILLFYPIPLTRLPITMAAALGRITAKYRWFAVVYLVTMFLLLPLFVFALSLLGLVAFYCLAVPACLLVVFVIGINIGQKYWGDTLPAILRNWNFLPIWLRSLEPYDMVIMKVSSNSCCGKEKSADLVGMKSSGSSSPCGGIDNFAFVTGDNSSLSITRGGNGIGQQQTRV